MFHLRHRKNTQSSFGPFKHITILPRRLNEGNIYRKDLYASLPHQVKQYTYTKIILKYLSGIVGDLMLHCQYINTSQSSAMTTLQKSISTSASGKYKKTYPEQ